MTDPSEAIKRLRREPPAFRRVAVDALQHLTPHLMRVTLAGDELEGLEIDEPAASVRLLLPSYGGDELVMPEWTGNEFLLPDGRRPLIRTLTPRHMRHDPPELDVDIHGDVGMSGWAKQAKVGDPAAVSGPGRGYEIDPDAPAIVLLGDETSIPAIAQLLEWIPASVPVRAHIEVARPDARLDLPDHPDAVVVWHDLPDGAEVGTTLLPALAEEPLADGARVWAAGEAAAMQHIRKHLKERGIDRSRTTVRGYWKAGRAGPGVE